MIQLCLNNEKQRAEIAANGRELVMRDHTWDVRVDQLLKELPPILKQIRYSRN